MLLDTTTARVYWYGESAKSADFTTHAIHVYSSHNLARWRFEGVALRSTDIIGLSGETSPGWILERPKVLFNVLTGLYVLWAHLEGPAMRPAIVPTMPVWSNYMSGAAAVAVSRTPAGPFRFVHALRPSGGLRTFDASLFFDERTRKAYRVQDVNHASVGYFELDESYTNYTGRVVGVLNEPREGVAPFFWKGRYYLATSGLAGWAPSSSKLYVRDDLHSGAWESSNPFPKGPARGTSFFSQSAHVLVYEAEHIDSATAGAGAGGASGGGQQALWIADRWCAPRHRCKLDWCPCLLNASYLWMPLVHAQRDGDTAKVNVQWCGHEWRPPPPSWKGK